MHQTSEQIGLFELHDAEISSIEFSNREITLSLLFAFISGVHPSNPFGKAQTIKPCTMEFRGVHNSEAKLWNDNDRVFGVHPEPENPIVNEVIEFEVIESVNEKHIKVAGFYVGGWAEWSFICESIVVSWEEFSGNAWYEK